MYGKLPTSPVISFRNLALFFLLPVSCLAKYAVITTTREV